MKCTYNTIVQHRNILRSFGHLRGDKFVHARERNLTTISRKLTDVDKFSSSIPLDKQAMEDYKKALDELLKKFQVMDEKTGKPSTFVNEKNGQMEFKLSDDKAFEEEFKQLQAEHAALVKQVEDKDAKVKAFLETETEINYYCIDWSGLPSNINGKEKEAIGFMFTEQLTKLYMLDKTVN